MTIKWDKGFEELADMLEGHRKGFKDEANLFLEASGMQFLEEAQNEVIRTETVVTRRLLNSFGKGDSDNIWSHNRKLFTLEVGTNVEYAKWVNDGHRTTPRSKNRRWVEGKHYFDTAWLIFQRIFEQALDKKIGEWFLKGGKR